MLDFTLVRSTVSQEGRLQAGVSRDLSAVVVVGGGGPEGFQGKNEPPPVFLARDKASCPQKWELSVLSPSRWVQAALSPGHEGGPGRLDRSGASPSLSPMSSPYCLTSCQGPGPPACRPLATPLAQVSRLSLLYSSRA